MITTTENHDHEELLAEHFRQTGRRKVHLCPYFHHMAIHEDSQEFKACQCDKQDLR